MSRPAPASPPSPRSPTSPLDGPGQGLPRRHLLLTLSVLPCTACVLQTDLAQACPGVISTRFIGVGQPGTFFHVKWAAAAAPLAANNVVPLGTAGAGLKPAAAAAPTSGGGGPMSVVHMMGIP